MLIERINFDASDVGELLALHLREAGADDCSHAFGLSALRADDMQMWSARDISGALLGFGALKSLGEKRGEIKSMRTHPAHLRKGVSSALMAHIETAAKTQGMTALYLETHPTPAYDAARALYERLGYRACGAFGAYAESSRSVFMMKNLP